MSKAYRKVSSPPPTPMTEAELRQHRREQAEERQRRGFGSFTRPEVREEVLGQTQGESTYARKVRESQVNIPAYRRKGR